MVLDGNDAIGYASRDDVQSCLLDQALALVRAPRPVARFSRTSHLPAFSLTIVIVPSPPLELIAYPVAGQGYPTKVRHEFEICPACRNGFQRNGSAIIWPDYL